MKVILVLQAILAVSSGAAASDGGRLKRQEAPVVFAGRLTLRPEGKDASLKFSPTDVRVTIRDEPIELSEYLTSQESTGNLSLYWITDESRSLRSPDDGFTAVVKVRGSQIGCSRFRIVDFRATIVVRRENGGDQKTFAVPPSALTASYDCASGIAEKTFQLKPIDEMDCVEAVELGGPAVDSSNQQPPYYHDGETYTFNCYAKCTCVKSRSGCVSVCPPFQLTDASCRKAIRGSECCETPQFLSSTLVKETCANGSADGIDDVYPPWIVRLLLRESRTSNSMEYATILNENWIIGSAELLRNAATISTSPHDGGPEYNISTVHTVNGFVDVKSTPERNLALAELANPITFTGRGPRGVNLARAQLCGKYIEGGCPISVFPFVGEVDGECSKSVNSSMICVKVPATMKGQMAVGSGVVINMSSEGIHDLVGVLTEKTDGSGKGGTHEILNLCPHLEWIQSVMNKK